MDEDSDGNGGAGGNAFDPDKPDISDDDANGMIEDTFHDAEMEEESD